MSTIRLLLALMLLAGTSQVSAQTIIGSRTTASSADVAVSYGPNVRYPRNYDQYRNMRRSPYALSPYLPAVLVPDRIQRPQLPAMVPYTDLEYGQLMQTALQAAPLIADRPQATTASVLLQAQSEQTDLPIGTAAARVVDVLDRGTLVLDTNEEVRLRGLMIPSVSDRDEVVRYYARTGADAIRRLTRDQQVYIKFSSPERDSSGVLLGEVFLEDGSYLNRKILELGYGRFDTEQFQPGEIPITLQAAELRAKEGKVGIFSRR